MTPSANATPSARRAAAPRETRRPPAPRRRLLSRRSRCRRSDPGPRTSAPKPPRAGRARSRGSGRRGAARAGLPTTHAMRVVRRRAPASRSSDDGDVEDSGVAAATCPTGARDASISAPRARRSSAARVRRRRLVRIDGAGASRQPGLRRQAAMQRRDRRTPTTSNRSPSLTPAIVTASGSPDGLKMSNSFIGAGPHVHEFHVAITLGLMI